MRIAGVHVDGFGIWSDLSLDRLSNDLHVFYGPNEAGKSTLMQFVRSVLYGFSVERRKYLPPVHGGRPGGSVELTSPNGRFHVLRHDDVRDASGVAKAVLEAADGTRQGEHLLKVLLCNIDEAIFRNVFAVGLREMQELGALGDTEAAEMLYSISAGLDRVSLIDVIRELEQSRNALYDSQSGEGRISRLLERRNKLRAEIEELSAATARYARLASTRNQMDREISRFEEEKNEVQYRAKIIELSVQLRDKWVERARLNERLAVFDAPPPPPEGAVEQLAEIENKLETHRRRMEEMSAERRQLKESAAALAVNDTLWRQAARIEALCEQESWIASLQSSTAGLYAEIERIENELRGEREQLGLGHAGDREAMSVFSKPAIRSLRTPARRLGETRRQLSDAKDRAAAAEEKARTLSAQIAAGLSDRGETSAGDAVETVGDLVSRLRRRVEMDERLERMTKSRADLERQAQESLQTQLLPPWVLIGLTGTFIFGGILIIAGLFMPDSITGTVGWGLALLGLVGAGTSVGVKFFLDRSNSRHADDCRKQLHMLQSQMQQTRAEAESLTEQLPPGTGNFPVRLEEAERELAGLETLLPIEGRLRAARQEHESLLRDVGRVQEEVNDARRRWRRVLEEARLPADFTPTQVKQVYRRLDAIERLVERLRRCRDEVDQRQRELDTISDRVRSLVEQTEIHAGATHDPVEQLHLLKAELAEQEQRMENRESLRKQAAGLRRKRAKVQEAMSQLKYRRREILHEAGAENEEELHRRADRYTQYEELRRRRDAVQDEIENIIHGQCPSAAIEEQLAADALDDLEGRWDKLQERVQHIEAQLRDRFEKRGQLAEQLKAASEDRRQPEKQLELQTIVVEMNAAVRRWRVLATASRVLDSLKKVYESERQPETLQEASGYLNRMTQGRYVRVWTPLGRQELLVDDASGKSLPVEALSRGTREQLFLALRLALVSSYGRRGAPLPLILDDVLVNFDARRAEAAAGVLRDFAKAGHQVLVFTCHDHIAEVFRELGVSVDRLPGQDDAPKAAPKKTKTSSRPAKPQPAAAAVEEKPAPRKPARPVEVLPPEPEIEETPELSAPWEVAEVHDVEEDEEDLLDEVDEEEDEYEEEEYEEDDESEYEEEYEDEEEFDDEEYEEEDEEEENDDALSEEDFEEFEPEEEAEEGYRWYDSDEDGIEAA